MVSQGSAYAINALSWLREDGCIKVPHPTSRRLCYLVGDSADVFECIDLGLSQDEMLSELEAKHPGFTEARLRELIDRLLRMELIQEVGQFD